MTKYGLLIIDVQNDYFSGGKMVLHEPEKALHHIQQLEHDFKSKNLPIIYIQHINIQPNPAFFEKGTDGVALHSELAVQPESIIIEKHFPNSFFQTELQATLDQLEVDTLVITGMMTHMCVDSTTRAAAELSYNPVLIHDATATRNLTFNENNVQANDVQNAFISSLSNFSTVMSTDDWIKA
ncbi:cysteine hydrolase family protein [Staphylococcus pseudintermedius]|uniref:cysteine hydrolase family protein n=1 Tax=Staphylococcus pseudintermedius TaxID=283734 RepID=UPI000C6FE085|nr:cysteine hydrolase family protein [Staphylococcus pseudintermedius]PKW55841.1 cysteine hydrolase [Staphylococcus pseudintermedius]PPD60238.1 cysteine hydrolase [Staphylococcus pseudintermedius]PPD62608.1 cysteine hydrolase [Staphylococcus pseudintermedius]PPD64947.1 cysteine hydrolase [Staphylococcus pseudintermedius]